MFLECLADSLEEICEVNEQNIIVRNNFELVQNKM